MNNAITTLSPSVLHNMDDVERAAKAMAASGFFQDTKQLSQAIVKILAGSELGFGPFSSMTGVHIIQNKPTLAANLMAAAVKRGGKYNYRVIEHSDNVCELAFFEAGQEVGRSRFSMDDANQAGLTANQTWKKYPRNMLFARALSNGQKWFAPDVFGGATVYTPEELGANVDGEGNVIDLDFAPNPDNELSKMEQHETTPPVPQSSAASKRETHKPDGPVGWLLDWGVDNTSHAAKIATLLKLTPSMGQEAAKELYENYRALRDDGQDEKTAAAMVLD